MSKNVIDNKHGMFILIARAKTAVDSAIPVMIDTLNILKKYNGTLPVLSNQKYNQYIKTVLKKCGINKTLSSHAARKTFAMLTHNTYAVPIDTVSKMLGHASVQTTQHYYAKTDFEKIAQDMHLMARVKRVA
jgi:integrase